MIHHGIEIHHDQLAVICQRYGIRRLSLFGSILGPDFGPESDVDVLVEFLPGIRLGLRYFELEQRLSDLLGREVDLNTSGFLSSDFRDEVVDSAEVLYDASA